MIMMQAHIKCSVKSIIDEFTSAPQPNTHDTIGNNL